MTNLSQKWAEGVQLLVPFTRDYFQELHASQLARILQLPQKTTARKLERLGQAGALCYRRIGRNKHYFLNPSIIFSILSLLENHKSLEFVFQHSQVSLLLKELSSKYSLILFGSYAKGTAKTDSDVDLVVFARKSKKIKAVLDKYPFRISVQYATITLWEKRLKEGQPLAKEIAKDHILFGEKEKIIKTLMDYFQTK